MEVDLVFMGECYIPEDMVYPETVALADVRLDDCREIHDIRINFYGEYLEIELRDLYPTCLRGRVYNAIFEKIGAVIND